MSNVSNKPKQYKLDDRIYDNLDINEKMRVPKRIKVSADHDGFDAGNKPNPWEDEKFDMKVPDRILVVGPDQYCGTTAPPREVILDNIAMPPDPEMVRVQTPPRVITLNDHFFPTVEDEDDLIDKRPEVSSDKSSNSAQLLHNKIIVPTNQWASVLGAGEPAENSSKGLTVVEELTHLRSQMAKLNRRLMALELENMQRQQKERYLLALGLGYFLIKFVTWLNK